ncbi:MAG: phosphomannose isomerase type II C-terminal cupin domain [bacterium]|jgi:mannose-6-phosphate isomerase
MNAIYEETRPWGNFRQFTKNEPSTVKVIKILPGQSLSLQTHEKRSEFWQIIDGDGVVEIEGVKTSTQKGQEFFIKTGEKHRATAGKNALEILEIAFGEFDESDITRLEDQYGRN